MRWRDTRSGQPASAPPFPPACQDALARWKSPSLAGRPSWAQLLRPPPQPSQPRAPEQTDGRTPERLREGEERPQSLV